MIQTLEMEFLDSNGKIKTITIPSPRDNITRAEAVAVMEDIIAKKTFVASKGDLVGVHRVKLHKVNELK